MNENTAERLAADIKAIADNAQTLLKAQGEELAEKTEEIRDRLASALETAEEALGNLTGQAQEEMCSADQWIRDNPYKTIGIAVGVGLAIGLLLKRQ